jgi:VIT1/CCC1 family predicted Fe2+/Mn2+ transporter
MSLGDWILKRRLKVMVSKLVGWVLGLLDKLPGKGGRTAVITLAGIVYGVSGAITGHLTIEQATTAIVGSLGLAFAAVHK